jgi:esterase/lipase superfamily enzyme
MKVNIVDNAIPANRIEGIDDTRGMSAEELAKLVRDAPWDEPDLKNLVEQVVEERDWVDIRGYTNPEFFLADRDRSNSDEGGMVLLDWDTGMDGVTALTETLKERPRDGVFIITGFDLSSRVSEQVAEHFGDSAQRIALFRKGPGSFSFIRMLGKLFEMAEAGSIILGRVGEAPAAQNALEKAGLSRVWYATNRRPVKQDPLVFGPDRDEQLHYGSAWVRVSSKADIPSDWKIARCFGIGGRRSAFSHADALTKNDFYHFLQAAVETGRGDSDFLLFVHGFNVPFDAAMESIAQIAFDIHYPGHIGAFSWPSLVEQSKNGYMADKETAVSSVAILSSFLLELAAQPHISRIHVLGHSMGNYLILHALDRIVQRDRGVLNKRIGQLVLIAADVPAGWFKEQAFGTLSDRMTVYSSSTDWALMLAQEYQNELRLGLIPPVTLGKDCDTIDASICKSPFLGGGHDYYTQSTRLLGDYSLVLQGHPVQKRPFLETAKGDGGEYWILKAMA